MALFKKRKEESKTEEKKETKGEKVRVGLPEGKPGSRNSESGSAAKKSRRESEFSLPGKDPRFYKIIEKPVQTEKAVGLARHPGSKAGLTTGHRNKYVFKVGRKTNKIEIRKAIEKIYEVKVKDVKIINTFGKKKQVGRFEGWKPGFKKAVITLKKGYTITNV